MSNNQVGEYVPSLISEFVKAAFTYRYPAAWQKHLKLELLGSLIDFKTFLNQLYHSGHS